jgi:hypothetical protein
MSRTDILAQTSPDYEYDLFILKIIFSSPKNKLSDVNKTNIDIGKGQNFELLYY